MKSTIFLALAIGLATTFTSCKEDFLDVTPTDRLSDDAIVGDSVLFEAFVINRYLGARQIDKEGDGAPPGFGRGWEYALWGSLTDESIYRSDDNTWLIQRGQLSPENTGIAGALWGRSYRSIREVNYALAHIEEVQMSQAHKNLLTAELRFIRAFRYHDLIRNYGRVVLLGDRVAELGDDFSDPAIFKRSSIQEGLEYAVSELNLAAEVLPMNHSSNWGKGRATKGAALALKSRLLLYAASPLYKENGTTVTWQQSAEAAKAVMDLNQYSISSDYASMFIDEEGNNSEIIFARYYNLNSRHTALEIANGPNGYDAWGGNTPLQNLVDAYEMANGRAINDPASGYNTQAPYTNRDPRFYATILYNGAQYRGRAVETFRPGGRDSQDGPSSWNTSQTGYYLRKFMDDENPIQNPWNVAGRQPWIYFRYAEILLNYAEAQNEATGPDASVYAAVNQVRQRAGVNMPPLPQGLSQEQMRKRIQNERQVELAFEEHRFYDVRRWLIAEETENVPAYGVAVTKQGQNFIYDRKIALEGRRFEKKHYWLPVPRAEIQASANKLEQNPGY
ncbi:RagB/SusD family nutrient uptake outer membrane protein [Pontibacter qinzhouensis]|uniref:RagB/SusD family nutrient uptake outer membrane protein n=1 Tax=Pontibacter qinzhouensis TaxID=2603253 RepID=A0A5C8K801_9BACT|nr:RagB/SusD family nutrient uptake outer membrane protein [Pontibacter qinzhouensis]TXK44855.1 RagB/SusD family nutrient uptake outer membrane protein [Pontibacter qinzhouensis]